MGANPRLAWVENVRQRQIQSCSNKLTAYLGSGAKNDSGLRTSGPPAVALLLPLPPALAVTVLLRNTFPSSTAVAPVALMSASRSTTPRYVFRCSGGTDASASCPEAAQHTHQQQSAAGHVLCLLHWVGWVRYLQGGHELTKASASCSAVACQVQPSYLPDLNSRKDLIQHQTSICY